jgi:predicted enzyme related to lactoylglutathione lyase
MATVGAVIHLELYARDLEESAKFYGDLFGWTSSVHDKGYYFWQDTEGNSGGFSTAGAPITNPSATFYIHVEDINSSLDKVAKAGGVIVRERTEIGKGHGYFGLFRDPAGNNIGLQSSQ